MSDFISKEWGAPVRPLLISEDSEVGKATRGVKKAGITGLGCEVSCVPALIKGPHGTHSDSDKLTELPCRPTGSSLGSPFPSLSSPFLQPCCVFCSLRHLDVNLPQGLSPAPPQISAGPTALFLSGLCQNVSLVSPPAPLSVGHHHPHPCCQHCLTPGHGSLSRHPT